MAEGYIFDDSKDERGKPQHLHRFNGKPLIGTSTVMNIVAKPLTWWAAGEAVKVLGWTPITEYVNGKPRSLPRGARVEKAREFLVGTIAELPADGEAYLSLLDAAYKAHSQTKDKAATKGKDLHAALERYVKFSMDKNEGAPANVRNEDIQSFIEWSCDNVVKFLWSEMHCYSEKYWVGGITDAGAVLKDGKVAIIDFKSSKAAYPNQFWQCAGYDIQIGENGGYTAKGEKILEPTHVDTHIIVAFGAPVFEPAIIHDDRGLNKEAFLAALTLYKANQALEA